MLKEKKEIKQTKKKNRQRQCFQSTVETSSYCMLIFWCVYLKQLHYSMIFITAEQLKQKTANWGHIFIQSASKSHFVLHKFTHIII